MSILSTSRPGPVDPVDTIVVTGGPGIAAVDASSVRSAAARVAVAGQALREACLLTGGAWAHVVAPPLAAGSAQTALVGRESAAARQAVAGTIQQVTVGLRARAEGFEVLGLRLLRTAGLYEEAEGMAERIVGMLATAEGYALGSVLDAALMPQALGSAYRAFGGSSSGHAAQTVEPAEPPSVAAAPGAPPGRHPVAAEPGGSVTGAISPWTDEFVGGLGLGMGGLTGSGSGVTRAAGELAGAVRGAPVGTIGTGVRVEQLTGRAFANGTPAWQDAGAHSIEESLRRVDSLYPKGGAPPATIAVQQVTGADGMRSWVVMIPGTQSIGPAPHPWDGLTDAELLAGHPDQATESIRVAMTEAGVRADEPVVLVGHSLGGMAAMALATRPSFTERFRIGAVVTAGSPVATFPSPAGVPVLHLEAAEGVVADLDGRSRAENPRTADRVTVGRALAESSAPLDRAVSGQVARAHGVDTHVRTLALARQAGDPRVAAVVDRIEPLLRGERADTAFYRAERTVSPSASGPEGSPSRSTGRSR